MARPSGLTVAVTGPTGTFGHGLMPLLEADEAVQRVVGVARRPFDPTAQGWSKLQYRQGDVRDQAVLEEAFAGADVVVHLAFLITGTSSLATARSINVEGTLNAFRAAEAAGASRFVYASSVAAYGFHADNPTPITEEWPTRPAAHLFYAQEKADLEGLLVEASTEAPGVDLYLLRPPIVLGPHAVGAKSDLVERLLPLLRAASRVARSIPLPLPAPAPDLVAQFVHEDDVGSALLACVLGRGTPGAYNIAGDGVVTGAELLRELGLAPVPVPAAVVRGTARAVAALPIPSFLPPVAGWAEPLTHPPIVDATRAKEQLDWAPRYTSLEALRDTLGTGR